MVMQTLRYRIVAIAQWTYATQRNANNTTHGIARCRASPCTVYVLRVINVACGLR